MLLSWTDAFLHADYPYGPPIASLKSFIMSPWTNEEAVDTVVREVVESKDRLQEKMGFLFIKWKIVGRYKMRLDQATGHPCSFAMGMRGAAAV